MRDWLVAGGLLAGPEGLLLVQNRRRNGSLDWSTPGGVIDQGETLLEGLTREVHEETGLIVAGWEHLAYEVEVDFADRDMYLRVEAHIATSWSGALVVDDPDGIVIDAEFVSEARARAHIDHAPQWVAEPLCSWLDGCPPASVFRYSVRGHDPASMSVERR